ncbi:hypothetical protein [Sphingomonas sp. Leaf257]|jgi:hypothetical protein|uniref:hypothetical protein n=1 Tax=Sphingomonas sp. Leaf257 TaxID=1736309 RepID=UPI000B02C334|nr:hypothetical protein [Sphingomonas sp. Leaf257]
MNDPDSNGNKAGKRLLLWLLIALGIAGVLLYTFTSRVAEPAADQRAPLNDVPPAAR